MSEPNTSFLMQLNAILESAKDEIISRAINYGGELIDGLTVDELRAENARLKAEVVNLQTELDAIRGRKYRTKVKEELPLPPRPPTQWHPSQADCEAVQPDIRIDASLTSDTQPAPADIQDDPDERAIRNRENELYEQELRERLGDVRNNNA